MRNNFFIVVNYHSLTHDADVGGQITCQPIYLIIFFCVCVCREEKIREKTQKLTDFLQSTACKVSFNSYHFKIMHVLRVRMHF